MIGPELIIAGIFTVDFLLRLLSVGNPCAYLTNAWNLVDLFSTVPFALQVMNWSMVRISNSLDSRWGSAGAVGI